MKAVWVHGDHTGRKRRHGKPAFTLDVALGILPSEILRKLIANRLLILPAASRLDPKLLKMKNIRM